MIVKQDALARFHLQKDCFGVACQFFCLLRCQKAGPAGRVYQSVVGAGHDLNAAVGDGCGIEGRPDCDQGVAIEVYLQRSWCQMRGVPSRAGLFMNMAR